jgi:hypothetical protein
MTDSHVNDGFAFDFDTAVAAARRDYPQETAAVTFIDMASPDGRALLWEWYDNASADFRDYNYSLEFLGREDPQAVVDVEGNRKLMIFNSNYDTSSFFGPSSPAAVLDFVFNHELGHLVAGGGLAEMKNEIRQETKSETDKSLRNQAEMAADCFGVLRSLSRGTLTVAEAARFSFRRGIASGADYATAPGIDAMLQGAEDKKVDLAKLTADEIKIMATDHAEECSVSKKESESLRAIFNYASLRGEEPTLKEWYAQQRGKWLENLSDVCEKSSDDSFTFQATAKTLSVILATGKEPYTGNTCDVTDKKWDKVRENIKRRADKIGARRLIFKQG